MADHSKPTTTSLYTDVLTELDGRLDDIAKGLDPANTSPTNVPTNSIRWSSSSNKWEKWNGSAWSDLSSGFAININGTVGAGTPAAGAFTTISASGVTTFSAGTVSAPSLTTSGDTNTGVFFPAADTIAAATGGAERLRIDSSGNVGIGTDSPAAKVHILGLNQNFLTSRNSVPSSSSSGLGAYQFGGYSTGTTTVASAFIEGVSGAAWTSTSTPSQMLFYTTPSGTTTTSERMRIDSSGNVGIGTSSPSYKLTLSGTGTQTISLNSTDTGTGAMGLISLSDDLSFYRGSEGGSGISRSILLNAAATNGTVKFNTAGSERMRITSAGEMLVGGTTEISSGSGIITLERAGAAVINLFRNDTSVASSNALGGINFYGNDTTGNTPTNLAYIQAIASGTHAAGDNPTDLVFGVTTDGTATVTEEMRLTSEGALAFGGAANYGTSGQVLTSQGNASPVWANAPGGSPTTQTYDTGTAATWTKPASASWVKIEMWGGGGSGGKGASGAPCGGGGGGGYNVITVPFSDLQGTVTYTVGSGGSGKTTAGVGNGGGTTSVSMATFAGGGTLTVYAYGGGGGFSGTSCGQSGGGGGGGALSAGGAGVNSANAEGGGAGAFAGGAGYGLGTTTLAEYVDSYYGGGGGAPGANVVPTTTAARRGGNTFYGGGGGGGASGATRAGAGGTSVFGGNGSAGAFDANASSAGTVPGGGSGGTEGGNSGAGAGGRVRFTYW